MLYSHNEPSLDVIGSSDGSEARNEAFRTAPRCMRGNLGASRLQQYSRAGFYAQLIHPRNGMVRKHLNFYGKHIASSYPSLWLSAALLLESKRLPCGLEVLVRLIHTTLIEREKPSIQESMMCSHMIDPVSVLFKLPSH